MTAMIVLGIILTIGCFFIYLWFRYMKNKIKDQKKEIDEFCLSIFELLKNGNLNEAKIEIHVKAKEFADYEHESLERFEIPSEKFYSSPLALADENKYNFNAESANDSSSEIEKYMLAFFKLT